MILLYNALNLCSYLVQKLSAYACLHSLHIIMVIFLDIMNQLRIDEHLLLYFYLVTFVIHFYGLIKHMVLSRHEIETSCITYFMSE